MGDQSEAIRFDALESRKLFWGDAFLFQGGYVGFDEPYSFREMRVAGNGLEPLSGLKELQNFATV